MLKTLYHKGFTLIELLITLAIISIIMLFAIPNWQGYVQKSLRIEVQLALQENALWLTQFYARNRSFTTTLDGKAVVLPHTNIIYGGIEVYAITLDSSDSSHDKYLLTATPKNKMANDPCGTFMLNHRNEKNTRGRTTTQLCWIK